MIIRGRPSRRKLELLLSEANETIRLLTTDVNYEGGVQYWIKKHDALALELAKCISVKMSEKQKTAMTTEPISTEVRWEVQQYLNEPHGWDTFDWTTDEQLARTWLARYKTQHPLVEFRLVKTIKQTFIVEAKPKITGEQFIRTFNAAGHTRGELGL